MHPLTRSYQIVYEILKDYNSKQASYQILHDTISIL